MLRLLLMAMVATSTALSVPVPETPEQKAQWLEAVRYRWTLHARSSQLEPDGDWWIWLIKTGRGWGKNRSAGQCLIKHLEDGDCQRVHLVAATAADARDTMVEGESGILAISPPWFLPKYEPSKRRLTWPNGAIGTLFSAEEPYRLRGPQCDWWWADELAAWKYLQETWDNLQFGARLGNPRGIITTTPRPVRLLKEFIAEGPPRIRVTHGHTYENAANLAPQYLERLKLYEGTRLGRQELAGELLDDNPDALWRREWIDRDRYGEPSTDLDLVRVVVGLDPSATTTGDEAGIVIAGKDRQSPPHYYVLGDMSKQGSPKAWAEQAVAAYRIHNADRLIYESNQGGEMVAQTIRSVAANVRLKSVHASRGKQVRAEPVSTLAESGRIHHVGAFPKLEDELCEWSTDAQWSPNRLDAMVYAILELMSRGEPGFIDRKLIGA